MKAHPCEKGLTKACLKSYEKWARQALAYKLSHLLLPKELSRRLPGVLGSALVGPGAVLPPGLVLPPGAIVPPGFTWPSNWTPWLWFIFTTTDPLWAIFPPGWKPGDPLPWGVELPPGYELPAGWTPENPPPAFFVPAYQAQPEDPSFGFPQGLFYDPWTPGPPHRPYGGQPLTKIAIASDGWESVYADGFPWATARNSLDAAAYWILTAAYEEFEFTQTYYHALEFLITRTIFRFPLDFLPVAATIRSASVSLFVNVGAGKTACFQRCPTAVFGAVADYLSFAGDALSHKTLALGENKFLLDSAARTYIQDTNPNYVYFMAREYNHDHQNDQPPDMEDNAARCYTHNAPDSANRPVLNLSYCL